MASTLRSRPSSILRYRPRLEALECRLVPTSSFQINVNATAGMHAINPNIYGTAFASSAQLNDLNAPLNRSGGNATTRYNWQANATNRSADWFYESLRDSAGATPGTSNESGDGFIS